MIAADYHAPANILTRTKMEIVFDEDDQIVLELDDGEIKINMIDLISTILPAVLHGDPIPRCISILTGTVY